MNFLRVNITYDAVNIIHDVIITPKPFPYTAEFVFVGVRINKGQQMRSLKKNRIRTCIVLSFIKKYLTRLGEMIIVSPTVDNYQFSQPR